uniref:exo-beta-N-acetylmuramidase NamZ family protein n=1 Tax=Robiginitomaculum antarcticum TaxID=437507 RepID=UPI0003700B11
MNFVKLILLLMLCLFYTACSSYSPVQKDISAMRETQMHMPNVKVGAERFEAYLPLLEDKSVAVIANSTSVIGDTHLVDVLLKHNIRVQKIFAPEHGFRGQADAGQRVETEQDATTGLPILSLYGSQKKPSSALLSDVDVMVFDIQDVGVRFYTYLSTLHYVMESCAENDVPLVLLDRPNPNGFYIDGPVLKPEYSSFIGLHPVPLVYGMTIGEYAKMINGEGWMKDAVHCDLTVVTLEGYSHDVKYALPVKPSPNLPNMTSIYLYPSLALFEGTVVSIGRGTEFPFQVIGHPQNEQGHFAFTPRPVQGAMRPKLDGQICRGIDLRDTGEARATAQLTLDWIIEFYKALPDKDSFFLANNFFNKLAGNDTLMAQIKNGMTSAEIKETWQADLEEFRTVREKYLLYK